MSAMIEGDMRGFSTLYMATVLIAGCSGWPLYSNLPDGDYTASPAGTDPSSAMDFNWTNIGHEDDAANELPEAPGTLNTGEGWLLYGSLDGVGWDPTIVPVRDALCGTTAVTLAFPPLDQGDYTGDIDWNTMAAAADGVLCARAEVVFPADASADISYDFLGYDLDACADPVTALVDGDGAQLGISQTATTTSWNVDVLAGDRVGVVLAGFVPAQTLDTSLTWRVGLALLPPTQADDVLCPSLPEGT